MSTERGGRADLVRIILAAPMKSASTYAGNVLRQYFQIFDVPDYAHVDFFAEHNITPWFIHDVRGRSFCLNFHMLPYASNLIAAREEQIAITVLWRNIPDMIVSWDDHQFGPEAGPTAHFFVSNLERYREASPEARYTFLIDAMVPWYLEFYGRWRACDVVLHPYEQLLAAERAYFYDMLTELLGGAPVDAFLDATLETEPGSVSRFNVGRIGRSAEKFPDHVKRRFEDKILSHPDREQLEVLLWELPWEVPALAKDGLNGQVVRMAGEPVPFFVSSGRAHPIERASWLASRFGERRIPRLVSSSELAEYVPGEPLM